MAEPLKPNIGGSISLLYCSPSPFVRRKQSVGAVSKAALGPLMGNDVDMSNKKAIYRVCFVNQDKVYELYCAQVYQSDLYGFIEVEELIFGERSQVLVDPGEERLQKEFSGVKRSYIPMHSVIRIDEVEKEGVAKVTDSKSNPVAHFPTAGPNRRKD